MTRQQKETPQAVERPLTPKQRAFCEEYLIDLNAAAAARRAGYSVNYSNNQGTTLLNLPNTRAEIDRLIAERSQRTRIDEDRVLHEIMLIASFDPADAFAEDGSILPLREMPADFRRAIDSLDVTELFEGKGQDRSPTGHAKRLRFADKLKALELLGKHLRLFTDKVELTGQNGAPIRVETAMSPEQSAAFDEYLTTLRASLVPPGGRVC